MSITRYPHGISSFGVPVLGAGPIVTTGNVWFVDDSGSDSSAGTSPTEPFKTLDYAIGRCTASQGDTIVLMPGHAETTTAIAVDVIGIRIVGLGIGADRPTITASTGASDLMSVTAASCSIENVILKGAASGVTALLNIAADDCVCRNVLFSHGAAPTDAVTIASGARACFYGCKWYGTADGPDTSILFESATENASKDFEVIDCVFNYGLYGLDEAAITNESNGTVEGGIIKDCVFSGMVATAIDFNSSSSSDPRGIITGCVATGNTGITIAAIYDNSSYASVNNTASDALDSSGPRAIPAKTAS